MAEDKNVPIKVAVIGLGPVGLILAVHLKEAGYEVAICDFDKIKINLIRSEGIKLDGVIKKQLMFDTIYSDTQELKEWQPAIVFASIKGYQTPAFVEQMMKMNLKDTLVVSAQNGLDVEQIFAAGLGENKVMRMVINYAGNLITPNRDRKSVV